MQILALETSQRQGSLAALNEDGTVLANMLLTSQERTAQTLTPAIQNLLGEVHWKPGDLDLVSVAVGPGSFTGLRIGVVTAKLLAYATGAKLVGIHSLAALASQIDQQYARLWTILDAQRQELFTACFINESDQAPETRILKIEEWLDGLASGDMVIGPPLEKLSSNLPNGVVVAPRKSWNPNAIAIGRLGIAAYEKKQFVDPIQLVPQYFRRSAAEEKAEKQSA